MGKSIFRYTEKEIGHMQFWKYVTLFEEYKHFHNAAVGRLLYKTEDKPEKPEEYIEKKVVYF